MPNGLRVWSVCAGLILAASAFADEWGVTVADSVSVKSEPTGQSETLVKLPQGKQIRILGQRGKWVKLNVSLSGGFAFDGWVPANSVRTIQSTTKVAAADNLDQYFDSPAASTWKSDSKSRGGPFKITSGMGYLLHTYRLSTGGLVPGELFSYDLRGFGINVGISYDAWKNSNQTMLAGAGLKFQHGFYHSATSLKDSVGATFDTRSSNSSSDKIIANVFFEYRFWRAVPSAVLGTNLGYEFFQFNADDILDGQSFPIGLFVSQKTQNARLGFFGRVPLEVISNATVSVGTEFLIKSFVSESPTGATGINPKGKVGFAPYFKITYAPWGDQHQLGFGYDLQIQNITFSGTGTRVDPNNVSEGSASTSFQEVGLSYEYRF